MEIVKVDQKGRITIPAYARILLGLDPGDRVMLHVDPDRLTINMTLLPRDSPIYKCVAEVSERDLVNIVSNLITSILALNCIRPSTQSRDLKCTIYSLKDIEGAKCIEI